MLTLAKRYIKSFLTRSGYEICRLSDYEKKQIEKLGIDVSKLTYRDAQAVLAISAPGHISIDEGRFLGDLVKQLNGDGPIVEIGTLFGYSTQILALFKKRKQELISVDNYSWNPLLISSGAHELATHIALKDAIYEHNVKLLRADKNAFYEEYDRPAPELFFCDAVHNYDETLKDLKWAQSVGAKVIAGHDYKPEFPGVMKAVQELGGPSHLVGSVFVL